MRHIEMEIHYNVGKPVFLLKAGDIVLELTPTEANRLAMSLQSGLWMIFCGATGIRPETLKLDVAYHETKKSAGGSH